MTTDVRLLSTYKGFAPQSIISLPDAEATSLVSVGHASLTLTGGTRRYITVANRDTAAQKLPLGLHTVTQNQQMAVLIPEGQTVTLTGDASAAATVTRNGTSDTWVIGANAVRTIGPYIDQQILTVQCTAGTVVAENHNAAAVAVIPKLTTIAAACKLFYPWVRDASNNVVNKGPNAGDAVKTATSATAQLGGYFTSVAGTYGSSGTGRYYVAPAASSNFDPSSETLILNIGFNKATPAANENFAGTQTNSSTSGVQLQAQSSGNLLVNYKPGTTQNAFTALAGLLDSTDRQVTLVIDRNTKNGYLYADSVLRQTKTDINYTGVASALQTFVFGGYAAGAAYDAKFFNVQLYAIQKDVADINVQACVDKMVLQRQALTIADLGG